jgi:hypothetical protein
MPTRSSNHTFFENIRTGKGRVDAAYSTLMGGMDPMATYTGQMITWDQVMAGIPWRTPGPGCRCDEGADPKRMKPMARRFHREFVVFIRDARHGRGRQKGRNGTYREAGTGSIN